MYVADGVLYRHVNPVYLPHLRQLSESGLYEALVADRLLVRHEEEAVPDGVRLRPEVVPFISYPYEWCFGQLKAAALLTLEIQRRSLACGMTLKDASAYNVQFVGGRPTLIDTLSFEAYEEGAPWIAYRQFCEHFLAPLLLMADVDVRLGRLQREYIDGIPIDLAARLAPGRTKLNPALAIHLHAHAKAQRGAGDAAPSAGKGRVPKAALLGMLDSLRGAIERLDWKPEGTVWADYYSATNYSDSSFSEKKRLVGEMLVKVNPKTVWDFGANTGEFSQVAIDAGAFAVAWDVDPGAVERNYRAHQSSDRMLPLLLDLTNPSPGLGWSNHERDSILNRGRVDAILSLALVHHLAIGNNVPLDSIAEFYARISPWAVVEFVPKSDSQVQRLLSTRRDIYEDYHLDRFRKAFANRFEVVREEPIAGSERTLFLLRRTSE